MPDGMPFPEGMLTLTLDPDRLAAGLAEAQAMAEKDPVIYAMLLLLVTLMKQQMIFDDLSDQTMSILEKHTMALELVASRLGMDATMFRWQPPSGTDANLN